jgi:hypothetical protein
MKQIINGRILVRILILSIALSSCAPGQVSEPTLTLAPSHTPAPTLTRAPTDTPTPVPTSTLTPTPTPDPVRVERVNERVAALVVGESVQAFARCNLDAAVWGGYDIKVTVASSYTTDQSPHVFSIINGVFSDESSTEDPSSRATYEGSGFVEIEDQETTFELGIPFFVTDVTFDGDSTLNYTVISNPNVSVEGVFLTIEQRSASMYSVTYDARVPFRSDPEPQQFSYTLGDETPREGSYLAIQKYISGTNNLCLQSNHVSLDMLGTP